MKMMVKCKGNKKTEKSFSKCCSPGSKVKIHRYPPRNIDIQLCQTENQFDSFYSI